MDSYKPHSCEGHRFCTFHIFGRRTLPAARQRLPHNSPPVRSPGPTVCKVWDNTTPKFPGRLLPGNFTSHSQWARVPAMATSDGPQTTLSFTTKRVGGTHRYGPGYLPGCLCLRSLLTRRSAHCCLPSHVYVCLI